MKEHRVILALSSLVLAVPVFASLMLHTETAIPTPTPGETVELTGLVYKARFEAKVTSVRLTLKSDAAADPVVAEWVLTGSNSDGQAHRIDLQIRLFDDQGKQMEVFSVKHALSAGARGETFAVPMKVKADVWRAAKKVGIWANWIT